jgi:hypothetical protein
LALSAAALAPDWFTFSVAINATPPELPY